MELKIYLLFLCNVPTACYGETNKIKEISKIILAIKSKLSIGIAKNAKIRIKLIIYQF